MTGATSDVFGKRVVVERVRDAWRTSWIGSDGKHGAAGPLIPDFVPEHVLEQYLDELFHDFATPARPAVTRLAGDLGGR